MARAGCGAVLCPVRNLPRGIIRSASGTAPLQRLHDIRSGPGAGPADGRSTTCRTLRAGRAKAIRFARSRKSFQEQGGDRRVCVHLGANGQDDGPEERPLPVRHRSRAKLICDADTGLNHARQDIVNPFCQHGLRCSIPTSGGSGRGWIDPALVSGCIRRA